MVGYPMATAWLLVNQPYTVGILKLVHISAILDQYCSNLYMT